MPLPHTVCLLKPGALVLTTYPHSGDVHPATLLRVTTWGRICFVLMDATRGSIYADLTAEDRTVGFGAQRITHAHAGGLVPTAPRRSGVTGTAPARQARRIREVQMDPRR